MIKVVISSAGREGKLKSGAVTPLVANLTRVASVMAEVLKETAFANNKKVQFDVRKPSALSDEYMRLLGSRFGNKSGWQSFAKAESDKAKPRLRLGEKGWIWANSDLWHKIARKDDASFNRTGGMWSGLRVRNFGANGAIIEFAGKSEGQTGEWKASRGRRKNGEQRKQKWSGKVNNGLKAWTVFRTQRVILTMPDVRTQLAFEQGVEVFVTKWFNAQTFGSEVVKIDKGNVLAQRFANAFG